MGGQAFREEIHDPVVQGKQSFGNGKPHSRSRKGLGHRIQDMRRIRHEAFFHKNFAVLQDHDAVQLFAAVGNSLKVGGKGFFHFCRSLSSRKRSVRVRTSGRKKEYGQQKDAIHNYQIFVRRSGGR